MSEPNAGRAPVVPEAGSANDDVDLDAIAADLDAVERALERLDDSSYWTDEVSGEPISDELHARDPIARRSS